MNGPGTDPLLVRLAAGDEGALAALYDRFAGRMYRAALRMLGRREDAEDAVQEVFLGAVRSRAGLVALRDVTAYLFAALHRAAGRCAVRRARALRTSPMAADEAIAPDEPPASDDPDWARIERAIRSLPERQREVMTLRIDGQLTFSQIAQVVGVLGKCQAVLD